MKGVEGLPGRSDAQLERLERSIGSWPRGDSDVAIGLDVAERGLDDAGDAHVVLEHELELSSIPRFDRQDIAVELLDGTAHAHVLRLGRDRTQGECRGERRNNENL